MNTLPDSITNINQHAFWNMSTNFEKIVFNGTTEEWGKIVINRDACPSGLKVQCTDGDIIVE